MTDREFKITLEQAYTHYNYQYKENVTIENIDNSATYSMESSSKYKILGDKLVGEESTTDAMFLNYILPNNNFDLEFSIPYENLCLTDRFIVFDSVYNTITILISICR